MQCAKVNKQKINLLISNLTIIVLISKCNLAENQIINK